MIQMTNPNMSQQMSNQPNQNNYAQLIKTFKNSTTSTNPDVMSFIKNDPKMMAALIRTQQHPSQQQQQQMSMQQNVSFTFLDFVFYSSMKKTSMQLV